MENKTIRVLSNKFNGSKSKAITFDDFIACIMGAREEMEPPKKEEVIITDTPLLPTGHDLNTVATIQFRNFSNGAYYVIMVKPAHQVDFVYHDSKFKNVGVPKIVMAVKVTREIIQSAKIVCVKDRIVRPNTKLFNYPYSNVDAKSGNVCFGSNGINTIKVDNPTVLHNLPDQFFSMINNDHRYGHNLSGLEYRPLLEAQENKPFNEQWLQPSGLTYKQWFENLL